MMFRLLYSMLFVLLTPFILLRLYWKGRRLPAYRDRIPERFSLGKAMNTPVDVWVHAVSLGEVVAATPLIEALLMKQRRVLVTTMTPTGSQQVMKHFGERVFHQYLPYDIPLVLRRFFRRVQPRVGIIMETELWPNLIHEAYKAKIPLILANARVSDKAFNHYERVRFFFKPLLKKFHAIWAQSELDATRFIALGASSHQVGSLGNIKFDLHRHVRHAEDARVLKKQLGETRTLLIAASTHDDEEHQLLSRLAMLKEAIPDVLLFIAPRHPERFQAVFELSQRQGFHTSLRSQPAMLGLETEVVVIDSLGELLSFYQISDYAFVGGSLVPIGGHNVLEPISMQVPVFCGPFMQNSKAICEALCKARALLQVKNVDEFINTLIALHENPLLKRQQILAATKVLDANKGTVARYVEAIEARLGRQMQ